MLTVKLRVTNLPGGSLNPFQHQPAQLCLDRSDRGRVRIAQSDRDAVIAFRQRHRKIERLIACAQVAAQRVAPAAIDTGNVSSRLEAKAGIPAIDRFLDNSGIARRHFAGTKIEFEIWLRTLGLNTKPSPQITQITPMKTVRDSLCEIGVICG